MKNLKPSQLPANTVIEGGPADAYDGLYIKHDGGYWVDLFSGCGCCLESGRVADDGCEYPHWEDPRNLTTTEKSDDYFDKGFKVIAVPPGFVLGEEALHGEWDRKAWLYSDGTGMHDCKGFNCEEPKAV
jgi:hypothetical protein